MGEVKWIKIVTDIFDDEKILLIESLPEADSIIVIWFKLLCLAGKQNNSGVFVMNNGLAYTDKMLATIFRRKEATVNLALRTFQEFGMIEIINDAITIPNWSKHQTLDQLEERKEYMREYMKKYREKQKLLTDGESKVNCKVYSKANVNSLDKEEEIEEEKEIEKDKYIDTKKEQVPYERVVELYHSYCPSLPKVMIINNTRKNLIKARFNEYKQDLGIFEVLFSKAEESDFLKGNSKNGWKANFDWLLNSSNMAKVIEDTYKNKKSNSGRDYLDEEFNKINKNDLF